MDVHPHKYLTVTLVTVGFAYSYAREEGAPERAFHTKMAVRHLLRKDDPSEQIVIVRRAVA